jgi:hypothetical protein
MKRTDLIEWGIVTVGLIFGFKFFESTFSGLVQLYYFFESGGSIVDIFLPTFILVVVYAISFVLLIRNSRAIALYLAGNSANEEVSLKIGKRALLRAILIGICIAVLISNLSAVILYLFRLSTGTTVDETAYTHSSRQVNAFAFQISIVKTVFALIVLLCSREISSWFVRKNELDELIFDSKPEN